MTEPMMKCARCGVKFPKRIIRCPNCQEIGISRLYKYVRYYEHSQSILKDRAIWYSKADSLNDPFEFGFYCPEMHINGVPVDAASLDDAIRAIKQKGVLSLSEINNNILMWSHYSGSHTGFCIEFERTDSNELGNWEHCAPVNYDENLPTFMPVELADRKTVTKILITKSDLWAYEKEWRIIAKEGDQTYPVPGNITGIIFGYKMPVEKRREIAAILGNTVMYMEATKSLTKFAVDIMPVALDALRPG